MSTARRRRYFVGLRLPAQLSSELERLAAQVSAAGLRCYPARDLHLTLDFIGELEEAALGDLEKGLRDAFAGASGARLELGAAGVFPERGRGRVFWAGFDRPSHVVLHELHRRARAGRGLAPDPLETWTPHVTLARARPRASAEELDLTRQHFEDLSPSGGWRPRAVELIESRPGQPEARYAEVASWPLQP